MLSKCTIDIFWFERSLDLGVPTNFKVHNGVIVKDHQTKKFYVSQVRMEGKSNGANMTMDWKDGPFYSLEAAEKYARGNTPAFNSWTSEKYGYKARSIICANVTNIPNKNATDVENFGKKWASENYIYFFGGQNFPSLWTKFVSFFSSNTCGSNCRDYTKLLWDDRNYGNRAKVKYPCAFPILENGKKRSELSVPISWTCDVAYYNGSDGCDCNCGAYDLDCENTSSQLFGCEGPLPVCNSNGICAFGLPPPGWLCSATLYASLDGCDCNCGIPDPDCMIPNATIYNCPDDRATCVNGTCVYPKHPSTWFCIPDYYNTSDGCDCNCGAFDPDCTNISAEVLNCPCNMSCSQHGFCIGKCGQINLVEMSMNTPTATVIIAVLGGCFGVALVVIVILVAIGKFNQKQEDTPYVAMT